MHFSKKEIKLFVKKEIIDDEKFTSIARHLKECEFCREYYENCRLYEESLKQAEADPIPTEAKDLAEKIYVAAFRSKIIDLTPLSEHATSISYLAADGEPEKQPNISNLATFYSEEPELVLRVMRNNEKKQDYLELVGEDTALIGYALIQIPEIDLEYVTDEDGRVELEQPLTEDISCLKWRVKMPEAIFDLEPLKYEPDKTEYREEIILETDHNDKIRVTFEGKTEGKQITIRILELDGRDDYETIKVFIRQNDLAAIKTTKPSSPVSFILPELNKAIKIRLYQ